MIAVDAEQARNVVSDVYRSWGSPVHAQAIKSDPNFGKHDTELAIACIRKGRELERANSLPARLMAGLRTLTAPIVVRIHGGEPK